MKAPLTIIALLASVSLNAQNFAIERNDTTYYCITERLTDSLITIYHREKILSAMAVELSHSESNWIAQREALTRALIACEMANDATNDLVDIAEEETALTKREIRRMKRKAVGKWFAQKWQEMTIATGALGVGVGIGYAIK